MEEEKTLMILHLKQKDKNSSNKQAYCIWFEHCVVVWVNIGKMMQ